MLNKILLSLILLVTISCKKLSDSEDGAIKVLSTHLNSEIKYSFGKLMSTEKDNGNFFEIEVNKKGDLMNFPDELIASSSILLFYNNLTANEKSKYKYYNFVINSSDIKSEFSYPQILIEKVLKSLSFYEQIVDELKSNNLNLIFDKSIPEIIENIDKAEFQNYLSNQEGEFGKLLGSTLYGFNTGDEIMEQKKEWIELIGVLDREKGPRKFNLKVSPNNDDYIIYKIELD